ncbi:MAG: hypothetical protein ACXIUQ_13455 [Cecembia sp.]
MKTLSIEKMENLSGGTFGSCFDVAAAASIAWVKWTENPGDEILLASATLAQIKLFNCAMS